MNKELGAKTLMTIKGAKDTLLMLGPLSKRIDLSTASLWLPRKQIQFFRANIHQKIFDQLETHNVNQRHTGIVDNA